MTTEKYYTIATKRGKEKIQDYYRQNKTLPLTHMGFGGIDGDDANYLRPSVEMTVVPNEWARIGIERKPDEGFIGGGATIENRVEQYKGKWICNVGIYDEDGELILISAYRPLLVDPEESIVSSYPINIQSVLANAEHVVVQTDTSITHPTHDEMNQALEELDNKLSKYATTDAAGLIELATPQEVSAGEDAKRAVTPATLKPKLDEIKELINESEGSLSQPATTERLGLTELATQQETDQRTGGERVVTAQTLDKPGLISFLQRYADEEVKKLKELIFGGNPSAALDTLFELANAYEGAADSIQNILNSLSTKLPTSTFETFQMAYNQWKSQIQEQVNRKWEAVDASTSRKGIVQLTNAVNSTSQVLAASALGLKTAYDKAVSAYNLANDKWTAVNASSTVKGIVKVIDSITSTNTTDAASPNSVKMVADKVKSLESQRTAFKHVRYSAGGPDMPDNRTTVTPVFFDYEDNNVKVTQADAGVILFKTSGQYLVRWNVAYTILPSGGPLPGTCTTTSLINGVNPSAVFTRSAKTSENLLPTTDSLAELLTVSNNTTIAIRSIVEVADGNHYEPGVSEYKGMLEIIKV